MENPGALGVLGALVAAIVALFTFFMNYKTALQNQKDSQFYEALKRFGDRDSPTVRSSAATILSQMAQTSTVQYKLKAPGPGRFRVYYNLRTIVDQLVTGLLLEDSPVCISSISKGLKKLISLEPVFTVETVTDAHLKLQVELCNSVAEFWGGHKLKPPANLQDKTWLELANWVGYNQTFINELTARHQRDFSSSLESYSYLYQRLTEDERRSRMSAIHDRIKILSSRLRATVDLLHEGYQFVDQEGFAVDKLFLNPEHE